MSAIKGKAQDLKKEVKENDPILIRMADELKEQLDELHSGRVWDDKKIETLLLRQKQKEVDDIGKPKTYPKDLVKFNPSGASATEMDLYLKAKGYKERQDRYPYHNRWTRNSTAVHEAVQRDLLYTEKQKNRKFRVARTKEGLPAWENNVLRWVKLEHKGKQFILNGMLDGILVHEETGRKVGFEFKTKSNTKAQVGYYLMKKPAPYHVEQCVAYYLLTGVRDYLITYEGLAKDNWTAGADAKPDLRVFAVHITDEQVEALLDKWAYVTECVEKDEMPEDTELGFFSGYGYLFDEEGNFIG